MDLYLYFYLDKPKLKSLNDYNKNIFVFLKQIYFINYLHFMNVKF